VSVPGAGLEEAIDELYGVALEDFTRERNRIAKELRAGGSREDADAVAKLRKPSVAAWVLNQLARRNRRDVDLLLDAGHRLREAQVAVLGGAETEEFDRARKTESEALKRLNRDAEQLLRERGAVSASVLQQVDDSLRAAAISAEGRELLARGRFTQPLQAGGFDVFGDLAGTAAPRRTTSTPDRERRRRAREAVRAAKERVREAERRVRSAETEVEQLTSALEAAERTAASERERLDAATDELRRAESKLGEPPPR
jgi:hypothetical protein